MDIPNLMGQCRYLLKRRLVLILASLVGMAIAIAIPIFAIAQSPAPTLPALRIHPLPPALQQWRDPSQSGDYFGQIKAVSVGYLVWSEFPIKVFVEPPAGEAIGSFEARRSHDWLEAMQGAIAEWNAYLPLKQVTQAEAADITIWRQAPPLRLAPAIGTHLPVPRARTAETRFELYSQPQPAAPLGDQLQSRLTARFTIHIQPNQSSGYTLATARHELGHALGIWGHSPQASDALYFSQVRQPPLISPRDINTLKRIYEQPTRLGWARVETQSGPVAPEPIPQGARPN